MFASMEDTRVVSQYTMLHSAVMENNEKVVKFLLKHDANPNARMHITKHQPFQNFACDTIVNPEMREIFFRHRSSSFSTNLFKTITDVTSTYKFNGNRSRSYSNAKEFYRQEKQEEQPRSPTPVHLVAANGNLRILLLLLKYGANVNMVTEGIHGEYTPLVIAILNKHYEIAELLINQGANVNQKSRYGKTALYYAVKTKQMDIIQLLLRNGADVNSATDNGVTALHVAVERKLLDVTELLLKNGSDVNAKTKTGVTPLHSAAVHGHREVTELILNYGADVRVIMKKGDLDVTPLLWVTENESRKIRDIIYKHAVKTKGSGFYARFFKKIWKNLSGR